MDQTTICQVACHLQEYELDTSPATTVSSLGSDFPSPKLKKRILIRQLDSIISSCDLLEGAPAQDSKHCSGMRLRRRVNTVQLEGVDHELRVRLERKASRVNLLQTGEEIQSKLTGKFLLPRLVQDHRLKASQMAELIGVPARQRSHKKALDLNLERQKDVLFKRLQRKNRLFL